VATFNINSSNGDAIANALAYGGLANFQLSPNSSGTGYTLLTDSGMADYAQSLLNQGGYNYSQSSGNNSKSAMDALAEIYGSADTSNEGAGTFGGTNNNGEVKPYENSAVVNDTVSSFFSKFGADAISIVVGLVVVFAAIWNIVKGQS
jgi:hypothetical protein